jgi:hypothetical protein
MRVLSATLVLIALTGCATKQVVVPALASPPSNEQQTLEQRVRALDDYLAKAGTPEPPDAMSPSLTQGALQEVSKRVPQAMKKDAQIRFVSDRLAIVYISYTLPDVTTARTQEVQFLFDGHVWNMFWMPEPAEKKKANQPPEPTRAFGPSGSS